MKHISTKECAVLIRKALKESFPGIKFSVVLSNYSGGSSIRVRWLDGPTASMVNAVAGIFRGCYFDSSTDFKGSLRHMIDGEQVSFGADHVFTVRDYSQAARDAVVVSVSRRFGPIEIPADLPPGMWGFNGARFLESVSCDAPRELGEALSRRSFFLAPRRSKTAGRVIFLGNDGHSDVGALEAAA